MSVARCREINARLRRAGITVHEYPGCWSRGNGLSPAYEGGVPHHTASAFGMALPNTGIGKLLANGRSDLSGPLCNWAGNDDGTLTFIAAFPANHAGASGGRSMGPLPTTRLFNPRVLGLEIVYPGTVPMRTAQYRAALIWSRIVADVVGHANIQRIRAHAEVSVTGKWDPGDANGRTINMPAFRTAATVIKPEENDMQPTDPVKDPGGGKWGWIWLNTQLNAAAIRKMLATQTGTISGLAEAVKQLAAKGSADYAAIEAAAERGTQKALEESTVNVDIDVTGPGGN
jgi:hypothetical protein